MFRIGKTPSRIFINYRRGDAAGFAGRLSDALSRYFGDGRVFRDIDGIEGGANFEDVLKQTAQAADAMIVLIGRDWMTTTNKMWSASAARARRLGSEGNSGRPRKKNPGVSRADRGCGHAACRRAPESLKPLVRHNAISLSDNRWNSDVTRLAKIVAIDIPGSAAEKILQWVRLVISIALFAAMFTTTGIVAWNVTEKAKELKLQPVELWQSGVTFVVIVGSSMLLLVFAHLIDESKRRYVYAGGLVGLLGSCACFVWLGPLDDATEPIAMFFGSTITAIAVLILMNLSGFKAR